MRRAGRLAVAALQVAAIAVFALVIWQNYQYRRLLRARLAGSQVFQVGERIPPIQVRDLAGRTSTLDFPRIRTALAIVEPSCGSCARTIADARHATGLKVISVATPEATRAAAEQAGIRDITYTVPFQSLPKGLVLKINRYPQIVLVDRGVIARICVSLKECRG